MPPLPFIPEVRHSVAVFENVFIPVDRLLPGDGYSGTIKPFRTIEDLHVSGAILGYLLGVCRQFRWPEMVSAQTLALIALVASLARQDLAAPHSHIALDGLFRHLGKLITDLSPLWQQVAPEILTMWQRDMPILNIADRARAMRLASAWRCYQ